MKLVSNFYQCFGSSGSRWMAFAVALFWLGILGFVAVPAQAQGQSLQYRSGMIPLLEGKATITTETDWRFLGKESAQALLNWWGQTGIQTEKTGEFLGLIVPTSLDPTPETGWAVVIDARKNGWIKADEEDARELNSLKWKEDRLAPQLNTTDHKLLWQSQNEAFGQYIAQVFGRRGVLELRSIAPSAAQLPSAEEMRALLGQVNFSQGNRYEDYVAGQDTVSPDNLMSLVEHTQAVATETDAPVKPAGPLVWLLVLLGFLALVGLTVFLPRRKQDSEMSETNDADARRNNDGLEDVDDVDEA